MPSRERALAKQRKAIDAIASLPAVDRRRLLELAGYKEERLVALLKRTLSLLEDKLEAHTVERLVVGVGAGVNEVREFTDRDHRVELDAIEKIMRFLGMYVGVNAGGSGATAPPSIVINLRSMDEPKRVEIIDVSPKPA